jgi:hypothetical protein
MAQFQDIPPIRTRMHEYATTVEQHSFIDEFHMFASDYCYPKIYTLDSDKLAPWLNIEKNVLKTIIQTELEGNQEYKTLYRGNKIKVSYVGALKLTQAINTVQAVEVHRYLYSMVLAVRDIVKMHYERMS